jgi:hypothetical protein
LRHPNNTITQSPNSFENKKSQKVFSGSLDASMKESIFHNTLEDLDSDDKDTKEDCGMWNSESTIDYDVNSELALIKALAHILVNTARTPLLAAATGGNMAMDTILSQTLLKPSSTVPFSSNVDVVDREPVGDQCYQKCAVSDSRTALSLGGVG